jgi:two-component system, cell cycle sensor histidine kinase and response regulator CckA
VCPVCLVEHYEMLITERNSARGAPEAKTTHDRVRDDIRQLDPAWRLAAIVDSSSDAILGGTLDGVITLWNASAARILGYDADEVIGRKLGKMIPRERRGELVEVMRRLREGKPTGPFDTQRRRKDGSLVDLSVTVAPVLDGHGAVVGAATVARDITERVRDQEHRRALESQLQQAELLGTVGQLASCMAHDFRNLLSVIVGYAELAEGLSADPELTGPLKEIGVAADRAESLADDLLTLGRRALAEPRLVDLSDLIRGISDLLSVAAGGGVRMDFGLPPAGAAGVLADPGQLEQVLLNLVLNARDAMPDGGTLTIAAKALDRCIELIVADTGVGMSPALAGHIFEPFFTTKPETGTGLGLSAVSSIVTEAGGSIEVDTGVGRGTAFRITFPRCCPSSTR